MRKATKQIGKDRRHKRIRAKISGTEKKPRLYVFKSANHIYAQLINDEKGVTLVSANDIEIKKGKAKSTSKEEKGSVGAKIFAATEVGKLIAKKALDKKIESIVFDRGGNKYHGRIKSLADGAREGGLKF